MKSGKGGGGGDAGRKEVPGNEVQAPKNGPGESRREYIKTLEGCGKTDTKSVSSWGEMGWILTLPNLAEPIEEINFETCC